jgi:hypothetical protein
MKMSNTKNGMASKGGTMRAPGGMGGDAHDSAHGKDGIPESIHHLHGEAGSHEHTRGAQLANKKINTGHPKELESFHHESDSAKSKRDH